MRKHLAIAFAAVVSLAAVHRAEARQVHHKSAGPVKISRSITNLQALQVDVAARPPYPTAETTAQASGKRGLRATEGRRTVVRGREARNPSQRAPQGRIGSGIVRSAKTGATARVAARYRDKFQAYVDDLEAHGASIYYMGGFRAGRCSPASQHPCGGALDVCQDYRGHVSGARDCHLPRPAEMAAIAKAHGLYEGSLWCRSPDYGHAQIIPTGTECHARGSWGRGRRLATMTGKMVKVPRHVARRHHQHVAQR